MPFFYPLCPRPQAILKSKFVQPCTLQPVLKAFLHSNIVWRGRGGPFSVSTCLEKYILHSIRLFDKLRMWKQGFHNCLKDFCPPLELRLTRQEGNISDLVICCKNGNFKLCSCFGYSSFHENRMHT